MIEFYREDDEEIIKVKKYEQVMFIPLKDYELLRDMLDLACEELSQIENCVTRGLGVSTPRSWKEYLKQLAEDGRLFMEEEEDD